MAAIVQASTVVETNGGTSHTRTFPGNTTAGNTLVLMYGNRNAGSNITGVSDPVNGAWTQIAQRDNGTNECAMYFFPNAASITSAQNVTAIFDIAARSQYCLVEISGLDTTGANEGTTGAQDVSGTTHNCGSVAQTAAGILLASGVINNAGASAIDADYTALGAGTRTVFFYRIADGTVTDTADFSTAGSAVTAGCHLNLLDAGGGGGSIVPLVYHHRQRHYHRDHRSGLYLPDTTPLLRRAA